MFKRNKELEFEAVTALAGDGGAMLARRLTNSRTCDFFPKKTRKKIYQKLKNIFVFWVWNLMSEVRKCTATQAGWRRAHHGGGVREAAPGGASGLAGGR